MKKLAIIIFGAFALATTAQAMVYDFVDEANNGIGEGGYATFITGVTGGNTMDLGLTVTGTVGGAAAFAYLDAGTKNVQAGIGVCPSLIDAAGAPDNTDGNRCVKPHLDNIALADILKVVSTIGPIDIGGMIFQDHGPIAGLIDYQVNGGGWMSDTVANLANLNLLGVNMLELRENLTQDGAGKFYLSRLTVVPVPAAVWLFGTAMLGLIGLRRKSRMEANSV